MFFYGEKVLLHKYSFCKNGLTNSDVLWRNGKVKMSSTKVILKPKTRFYKIYKQNAFKVDMSNSLHSHVFLWEKVKSHKFNF